MRIFKSYKHTIAACYIGYITQAIVNNFAPMLFVMFHNAYGISLEKIGLLITVNFGTQLLVDLISARYIDKIGYRKCIVTAHFFSASGLVMLALLPSVLPDPFTALCIASVVYAIGGGLIEVLISPIVEAVPGDEKTAAMSMLHSFYCWGSVAVILLSTVFFASFGIGAWRVIACLWAAVPLFNAAYFSHVPIAHLTEKGEGMTVAELLKTKIFWVFALIMVCAGASELAMSQWASAFAEQGLGVSKTVGDIAGPCFFAVLMGSARVLHAKIADRVSLTKYMGLCAALCAAAYLAASLLPYPALSLIACGLCGFSVGVMWPGTFSMASEKCPTGGTAMFALLALGGDIGCSLGPSLVAAASGALSDNLKSGIIFAALFPTLLLAGLVLCRRAVNTTKK